MSNIEDVVNYPNTDVEASANGSNQPVSEDVEITEADIHQSGESREYVPAEESGGEDIQTEETTEEVTE